MDDYLRKLQQDEIKNLQDTSRKRKYGLAKKAEQFRRITGSDVALLIYDRVSQQYYTYRSKEEDNWPPSMSEIKQVAPMSENILPGDFITNYQRNSTAKATRKTMPDIRLRKPAKSNRRKRKAKTSDDEIGGKRTPTKKRKTAHIKRQTIPTLPPPPELPDLLKNIALHRQANFDNLSSESQVVHRRISLSEQRPGGLSRGYFMIPPPPAFDQKAFQEITNLSRNRRR